MRLKDLGEREIIRKLLELIPEPKLTRSNRIDDAVLLKDFDLVVSCDAVCDITDKLPGMKWADLGWKLGVMCVSDVASKGACPLGTLISLNAPSELEMEVVEEFYEGLVEASREYGFEIWGGDLGEAPRFLASLFMLGKVKRRFISRRGAREGDLVLVTGKFGLTGAAYHLLLRGGQAPSEHVRNTIVQAAYRPRARLREGVILSEIDGVSSSIDSSDGLAESLYQLCDVNQIGIVLERVPIAQEAIEYAEYNGIEPLELALYGGEEYEIVFTVRRSSLDEVLDRLLSIGCRAEVIGTVIKERGLFLKVEDQVQPIERRGWEHYSRSRNRNKYLGANLCTW